jgi:hypothetical protein
LTSWWPTFAISCWQWTGILWYVKWLNENGKQLVFHELHCWRITKWLYCFRLKHAASVWSKVRSSPVIEEYSQLLA